MPEQFALGQNFPNPFNPETTIAYDLPEKTRVQVEVFDVLGQKVRTLVDGEQAAGRYQVRWEGRDENGRNAASGIYFYRLHTDGFHSIRRMVLLR